MRACMCFIPPRRVHPQISPGCPYTQPPPPCPHPVPSLSKTLRHHPPHPLLSVPQTHCSTSHVEIYHKSASKFNRTIAKLGCKILFHLVLNLFFEFFNSPERQRFDAFVAEYRATVRSRDAVLQQQPACRGSCGARSNVDVNVVYQKERLPNTVTEGVT